MEPAARFTEPPYRSMGTGLLHRICDRTRSDGLYLLPDPTDRYRGAASSGFDTTHIALIDPIDKGDKIELIDHVEIVDGNFVCAGKVYGPADHVLAYPGEETALVSHLEDNAEAWMHSGVIRCKTPHNIDILLACNDKVMGFEVKLPSDLIDSWWTRRLQRQMRTLRSVVDVPVLVMRAGLDMGEYHALAVSRLREPMEFWEDLTSLQTLGVYLLPVPRTGYLPFLFSFRRALATNGYRAVAGDDRVQQERRPGWLLRRIPGIGPQRSQELTTKFGRPWQIFQAAVKGKVAPEFGPSVQDKILKALEE